MTDEHKTEPKFLKPTNPTGTAPKANIMPKAQINEDDDFADALGQAMSGISASPFPPSPVAGSASQQGVKGYEELFRILRMAFTQASYGKGHERHSMGAIGFRPWHEQPILANARQVGVGGPAMQAMKKAQEAVTMANNGNFDGAMAELQGVIVYAAAAIKLVEEMKEARR